MASETRHTLLTRHAERLQFLQTGKRGKWKATISTTKKNKLTSLIGFSEVIKRKPFPILLYHRTVKLLAHKQLQIPICTLGELDSLQMKRKTITPSLFPTLFHIPLPSSPFPPSPPPPLPLPSSLPVSQCWVQDPQTAFHCSSRIPQPLSSVWIPCQHKKPLLHTATLFPKTPLTCSALSPLVPQARKETALQQHGWPKQGILVKGHLERSEAEPHI